MSLVFHALQAGFERPLCATTEKAALPARAKLSRLATIWDL
jgi:hypothetical protein